jgi:hypothetical protein
MRTTTAATLAGTALAATVALIGLGATSATASQAQEPAGSTVKERGIVLECNGSAHGLNAYVNVYENNPHDNYFQVILNEDPDLAKSREPADIWKNGKIRSSVRIDGHLALVIGTASKVGGPIKIHEEYDDAGQHIVADGIHKRLRNHLVLRYDGTAVPLTCDPAFYYKLDVTKTDITGD